MSPSNPSAPTLLKELFNRHLIVSLADQIKQVYGAFDRHGFESSCVEKLKNLTLKQRSTQIASALIEHIHEKPANVFAILLEAMGEGSDHGGLEGFENFRYMPFLEVVPRLGLDQIDLSMDTLARMTLSFSAEFAIRPFIHKDPQKVMTQMMMWSRSRDWRLRRLSSEGARPRLPWAPRIKPLIEDPSPLWPILNQLCADPVASVRRSVANNLNDIAKDHPDRVVQCARDWWSQGNENSCWTVRHGLRTLIKQGNQAALELLGYSGGTHVTLEQISLVSEKIHIGERLGFSLRLRSDESKAVRLVIDGALNRVLANGTLGRKVFKWATVELKPGESFTYEGRHSFMQRSTRTYYPGCHYFDVLVNGREIGSFKFEVLPTQE